MLIGVYRATPLIAELLRGRRPREWSPIVIAELLRGRRPREWSPIVILKGVLVIFYGHGKRNGSRARAPYIHTYIHTYVRTYVAFHDILT